MLNSKVLLLLAVAVGSATSATFERRDVANNNCGRAVIATNKGSGFRSTAIADCQSLVSAAQSTLYVTPSPTTVTLSVTAPATAYISSVTTVFTTETVIAIENLMETEISTSSLYSTDTINEIQTIYSTYNALTTLSSTFTVTSIPFTTITQYSYATSVAPAKRDLERRITSSPPSQTSYPAYASACRGFTEYTAACALLGISTSGVVTSTLPAATVSITQTTTSISSIVLESSATIISTIISTQTITETTTQNVLTTLLTETTLTQSVYPITTVGPSTITELSSVTIPGPTSTIIVSLAVPTFKIAMIPVIPGPDSPTRYLGAAAGQPVVMPASTDINAGLTFTLNSQNQVVETASTGRIINWFKPGGLSYVVGFMDPTYPGYPPNTFYPITCQINSDNSMVCSYQTYTRFSLGYGNFDLVLGVPSITTYPAYTMQIIPV